VKILHLYKDYFPVVGGIENHIKLLAEAQATRGHDVTVLVTSRSRASHTEFRAGVRVIFASRWFNLSTAPFSAELFRRVSQLEPDIAHLHSPYPIGEIAQLLLGRARATVLTYHSDIVRQRATGALYEPIQNCVLNAADTIIATSPNYIASSRILSRWRDKCVVVPLAIPLPPELPPISQRAGAGNKLLFVGRLRYYKGVNYLLEAMAQLPEAQLTIVGTGPKEAEWRNLANCLGLGDRTSWLGDVSEAELHTCYEGCDIFVLPCSERSEAFGTVQVEAMAAGKPVVSCDVNTGVAWVNQNNVTGLVVPPQDLVALAGAIRCLMNDPALRLRMGTAGRARVDAEFTVEKLVERVQSVYGRALHAKV
jgi:rhamnosyl/mannosyltransferase